MFVRTTCETAIRLDTVREVCTDIDGVTVGLRLDDGTEHKADKESWHRALEAKEVEVIPAQPGTYVLHETEGGQLIDREPVIAWGIWKLACFAYPITSGGFNNPPERDPLILHPDGTVQNGLGIFSSYEARMQEWGYSQDVDCPCCAAAAE